MGRSNEDELRFARRRFGGGWEQANTTAPGLITFRSSTFLCHQIDQFYDLTEPGIRAVILVTSTEPHPESNIITADGRVKHSPNGRPHLQSPGVNRWLKERYRAGRRYVRVEYEVRV